MTEFSIKSKSNPADSITVQLETPGEKVDPKADLVVEEVTKPGSPTQLKLAKVDTALLHFVAKHPAATDWNISMVNEPVAKPVAPSPTAGTDAPFASLAQQFLARENMLTQVPPPSEAQLDAFPKAYKAAAATYIKQHPSQAPSSALDAFNAKLTTAFKAQDGADPSASIDETSLQQTFEVYRHDLV